MNRFQSVGPRASKEEFLRALGLDPRYQEADEYYKLMRDEAVNMYNVINRNPSFLVEEKRGDPTISPPYYWHHIKPELQRWAINEVWNRARTGTPARLLFDRGATDGEGAPNWVTHWLLYSVFRARDDRNNRNNRQSRGRRPIMDGRSRGGDNSSRTHTRIYDPVRDR